VIVSGVCGSGIIPVSLNAVRRLIGRITAANVIAIHFRLFKPSKIKLPHYYMEQLAL